MIDIDTQQLQDMMNTLQQANNDIDRALDTLYSVTTHHGWACVERHTINDYILQNRKLIRNLQEGCSAFYNVAKAVADEFVETEKEIANLFPGVDSAIAGIVADSGFSTGTKSGGGSSVTSLLNRCYLKVTVPAIVTTMLKKCKVSDLTDMFKS